MHSFPEQRKRGHTLKGEMRDRKIAFNERFDEWDVTLPLYRTWPWGSSDWDVSHIIVLQQN